MENLLKITLYFHIAFGFTALLSGILAILFTKGSKKHNLSGMLYYWCMIGIGITAFLIAIPKGNMFLLMIGGFSTYMTLTGRRYLQLRKHLKPKFSIVDRLFQGIALVTVFIPIVYFSLQSWSNLGGFTVVFAVFGSFLLSMVWVDMRASSKLETLPKKWFLSMHISRMMGAFIATFTAFLVINLHTDPVFIAWLLPTVVFTPLIIYFQRKFVTKSKTVSVS
ncbi:hypothetical protein ACFOUP_09640 [Belliella kenyensis]|uniref:DUF2306 domain-containing protein n=1 Tax=Belliella kenyensis TaxID=1472724 RepID=A0ABV8EK56_9BACT|nr:hypothetical protein [Belliella kenyensis]MCH7402971.1 hypothetical protein [Belliella kenyensis]MDN3605007.1 hypothetical protein [Belliella kenyensis]